jgi:hypothetical protein
MFPAVPVPDLPDRQIQGTFTLAFVGSDGTFDYYAVSDVQLVVLTAGGVIPISGSGSYRIGGEPVRQQLSLDSRSATRSVGSTVVWFLQLPFFQPSASRFPFTE